MLALFYHMKTKRPKKRVTTFEDYYQDILVHMDFQAKGDMTKKCRICLQEGTTPMYNIDHPEEIEVLEILNIRIKESDDFPKKMCIMCSKFIRTVKSFRKIAKLTEELLEQPVKKEVNNTELKEDHLDTLEYSDDSSHVDTDQKWDKHEKIKKERKASAVKYVAKVTCHICKTVVSRSYFKQHVTMHDPDHKKYVCDVCGKSFRLRCAYHNHSLRHRTDFPYKCQFCPYRGRYSELLKNHMRTHTGDYRYMCTECPARFLFKSNLNSHMLKHKEPRFKCEACKRAFHTELMMQRHFEADHLGIKNHVCSMCGKAFGYRNAMMKHQRHVHKREKLLFGRMPAYLQAECNSGT